MKFKDYYAILGVARDADDEAIKSAYRRLARKYHPDVSSEKDAESRFKDVAEAYETLRDREKRAAYDRLGEHAQGEEFRPPPGWGEFRGGAGPGGGFEDVDLADLFAAFGRGRGGAQRGGERPLAGSDYEVTVRLSFEQAFAGTEVDLELAALEWDADGGMRRVPHRVKARIPRGVTDGEKLRVPGKGGKGVRGGPDGDLYLDIEVAEHPVFRVEGRDVHVDLPLAPWEAVLGASVSVVTPGGPVELRVPPATRAGQTLRLGGRGLARGASPPGNLLAHVRIEVPTVLSDRERALYRELAQSSNFDPRGPLVAGGGG
jgi:curved DNA-binding protein